VAGVVALAGVEAGVRSRSYQSPVWAILRVPENGHLVHRRASHWIIYAHLTGTKSAAKSARASHFAPLRIQRTNLVLILSMFAALVSSGM